MPIEKYIETDADLILKTQTISSLLAGQVMALDKLLQTALRRYQTKGDNRKTLIEGCFGMIEALEKVVGVQMTLNKSPKVTELAEFIKTTKEAFKALDLAEKQNATIH